MPQRGPEAGSPHICDFHGPGVKSVQPRFSRAKINSSALAKHHVPFMDPLCHFDTYVLSRPGFLNRNVFDLN